MLSFLDHLQTIRRAWNSLRNQHVQGLAKILLKQERRTNRKILENFPIMSLSRHMEFKWKHFAHEIWTQLMYFKFRTSFWTRARWFEARFIVFKGWIFIGYFTVLMEEYENFPTRYWGLLSPNRKLFWSEIREFRKLGQEEFFDHINRTSRARKCLVIQMKATRSRGI